MFNLVPGAIVDFNGSLDLDDGALAVGPSSGTLDLSGIITNGTIVDSGSGLLSNNGSLGGIVYEGILDLSPSTMRLDIIAGGLVATGMGGIGDGTILLGSAGNSSDALEFQDDQTIDNATIDLAGDSSAIIELTTSAFFTGSNSTAYPTLTLGPDLVLNVSGSEDFLAVAGYHTISGEIDNLGTIDVSQAPFLEIDGMEFLNRGTLDLSDGASATMAAISFVNSGDVDVSGGSNMEFLSPLTNFGTVAATGGSTLTLDAVPVAFGDLSVDATSTVELKSFFTLADLQAMQVAAGATVVVTVGNTLDLGGGTLSVGPGEHYGSVVLDGTIIDGTIIDSGADLVSEGTLGGVTYDGALDLSAGSEFVSVIGNGLVAHGTDGTGDGTIVVGSSLDSSAHSLTFWGDQSIDNATIDLTGGFNCDILAATESNDISGTLATLTLGPHLVIDESNSSSDSNDLGSGSTGGVIINQGTINAAGLQFSIDPTSFINEGTIALSGGGNTGIAGNDFANSGDISIAGSSDLTIDGALDNTGSVAVTDGSTLTLIAAPVEVGDISVDATSTLELLGNFTLADLQALAVATSATVTVFGTLDLDGGTLSVGPETNFGTLNLSSISAVIDGTIIDTGFGVEFNGGTLGGVTYDGTLDLMAAMDSLNIIGDGLVSHAVDGTGDGTIVLGTAGSDNSDDLTFWDQQTIDNATIDMAGNYFYLTESTDTAYYYANGDSFATLTLGPDLVLNLSGDFDRLTGSHIGGVILNEGTINAAGEDSSIAAANFTNQGIFAVSAGDDVLISNGSFANSGDISVTGGSSLETVNDPLDNTGTITVTDGSTLTITAVPGELGDISVDATSTLELRGTYTMADLQALQIAPGATVLPMGTEVSDANTLNLGGGTLSVGPGTSLGTYTLASGHTITDGTIDDSGSGIVFRGGSLDGVTYDGTVDLSAPSANLNIIGDGLSTVGSNGTGGGTIVVGTAGVQSSNSLTFWDNQTIDNTTINLNGLASTLYEDTDTTYYNSNNAVATLTLGPDLVINQSGTNDALFSGDAGGDIVNQGTINATGGSNFHIDPNGFTNQGTLVVSGRDHVTSSANTFANSGDISVAGTSSLTINGPLDNTGTIAVTNGSTLALTAPPAEAGEISIDSTSTLELSGSFTLADLQSLTVAAGATVTFNGTLDLQGGTLAVGPGASLGTFTLSSGSTITDGTIAEIGAGIGFKGGTLDGVTFDGTLDLSAASATVHIIGDGLAAAGADATIVLGSTSNRFQNLIFTDTQTIDNATIDLIGSSADILEYTDGSYLNANGYAVATLTLGPNLVINQSSSDNYLSGLNGNDNGDGDIVNQGTINLAGGYIYIEPNVFTNQGVFAVSGGDDVTSYVGMFVNSGDVSVTGASVLRLDDPLVNTGSIALTNGATLRLNTVPGGAGTLTGGVYSVGSSSLLQISHQSFTTLDADLTVSGAGSSVQVSGTSFETTLTDIGTAGVLRILADRTYTTSNDVTVDGTLLLGGGAFTAHSVTIDATGTVTGFGTLDPLNNGVIDAEGGRLTVTGAIAGTGSATIGAGATLELGGADAQPVIFTGASGTLKLDQPAAFTGSIGGFVSGSSIDLANVAVTGAKLTDVTAIGAQLQFTPTGGGVVSYTLLGDFTGDTLGTHGDAAGTGTLLVINTTNAPPLLSNTGNTVTFTQGGSPVVLNGTLGVSDSTSSVLASATLSISDGFRLGDTLGFTNTVDISGIFDATTGTLVLSGVASLAEYQAALDSIAFNSTSYNPTDFDTDTSRTVTWVADNGAALASVSAPVTTTVAVVAVVQPPVVSILVDATYEQGGAPVVLNAVLSLFEANSLFADGATVAITSGLQPGDMLNFTAQSGITGVFANGVLTLSGSAAGHDYQTALQSITYSSSNGDLTAGDTDATRSVAWQISNAGGESNTLTTEITIGLQSPVLGGAGNTITYTSGGAAQTVDGGLTVAASASSILTGATASIGGGYLVGDTLGFTTQPGIAGVYADGVLTLSGDASLAAYQAVLDSVTFSSTATDATASGADTTRQIAFVGVNGTAAASAVESDVTVAAPANMPPVLLTITGTRADQATTDQAAVDPFAQVAIAEPGNVTETATVTLSTIADGALSQLGGGAYDLGTGVYIVSGSAAAVTTALDGLVFTPTAFQVAPGAAVTTGFTLDVSSSSGATASDATTSVVATAAATWHIAAGHTLTIAGASHGQTIDFLGATGLLELDQPALSDLTIAGFTSGDHIDLAGVSPTAAAPVLAAGTLSIGTVQLDFLGSFTGEVFRLATAADGAAELTVGAAAAVGGYGGTLGLGSSDGDASVSGYGNSVTGQNGDSVVQVGGLNNSVGLGNGNNSVTTTPGSAYAGITLGDGTNLVALGGTLNTVRLGNGADTVTMTGSNNSVTAGNGPDSVSGGTGNSHVTLGDGMDSVALGGWGNSLTVGDGDDSIEAGAGGATIALGEGNDTVVLNGRNNSVTGGDGRDSVTGGGQSDTVRLGDGRDTVALGGQANVIVLGDGTNTVSAGSGSDNVQVGAGANSITLAGTHNTVVGGNGNDSVTGASSLDSIALGDGADSVQVLGDYDALTLGNGADSVTLGGVGNTVVAGRGGVSVTGGTGHSTVTLGTGDNHVTLGGWVNAVTIGGGTSAVDAGAGASSVTVDAGHAALTLHGRADFVFLHNAAQASITDLSAGLRLGIDSGNVVAAITGFGASSGAVLDLTGGAGFTSVAQVMAGLHSDGHGGTLLALGGAGSVDFLNLAPNSLHAGNFSVT